MKIALVDDDQACLDEMARLCSDFGTQRGCQIETIPFTSGEAFLDAFGNGGFSAVFMDIYMDGIDGVSAASKIRALDSGCILIFLTSSAEFMPEAFSCHAFEYVTKPFSAQRIRDVLTDVVKALPPAPKYIEVICDRKAVRIPLFEITSATTDAHYLNIRLLDGQTFRCRMTMAKFIELTDNDSRFILINKGITVNADYILEFENNCCILENGTRFPIRVRNRLKIEQSVRDYNFNKIRSRQRHREEEGKRAAFLKMPSDDMPPSECEGAIP